MLLVLISASVFVSFLQKEKHELPPHRRSIASSRDIAENLRVNQSGIYGVDLVSCARVRVEKMRRGPFALGAFNMLIIDDLKVVLPINGNVSDESKREEQQPNSAMGILKNLGVSKGFLGANGVARRFSGLRINGLEISHLDAMTNVVRIFTARHGELKHAGLELSDLNIDALDTVLSVSKAILKKSDAGLVLVWPDGELKL